MTQEKTHERFGMRIERGTYLKLKKISFMSGKPMTSLVNEMIENAVSLETNKKVLTHFDVMT